MVSATAWAVPAGSKVGAAAMAPAEAGAGWLRSAASLVVAGTPEDVAATKRSHTGKALAKALGNGKVD